MAANPRASIHPLFDESENAAVHPLKTIAISDDSQVIKIDAEKLAGRLSLSGTCSPRARGCIYLQIAFQLRIPGKPAGSERSDAGG